jgi:poly-gamma-glutamate capsule biosynthesis protein CapA/YwtB (metallophosphatase superfamily)
LIKLAEKSSFFLAGDAFQARGIFQYKDQNDVKEVLDRVLSADISFMNLEIAIHNFEGYPIGERKYDAYGQADPQVAEDIKKQGFHIVSRANNHAMDYTEGGMTATTRYLNQAGIYHAGTGMNLAEAREPAYIETSKGIVSLISATTWELGLAGHARKDVIGRPGVNPMRMNSTYYLDSEDWERLKIIASKLGLLPKEVEDGFNFPVRGQKFILGDKTSRQYTPHPVDLKENLKAIKDAKQISDWVIFSLHDHYEEVHPPEGYREKEIPLKAVVELSHQIIDSGADIYLGHGPHITRGIELYKGRPIFYSLGNYIFQSTLSRRQPADLFELWSLDSEATTIDLYMTRERPPSKFFQDQAYWESVVAELDYEDKKLEEIRLIPIHLNMDISKPLKDQRTSAGVPHRAYGEQARRIIENMVRLCKLYDTKVEYEDGIGVIIP